MTKHFEPPSVTPSTSPGASQASEFAPAIHALLDQIREKQAQFTPSQRLVADFVSRNPETLGFLSASEMGKKAGVSQASIVRFCNAIGRSGYSELSREVQQALLVDLGTVGRFQLLHSVEEGAMNPGPSSIFERVLRHEIENLVALSRSVKTEDYYRCVEMMKEADRICIIGSLTSSSLASFFGYMLSKIIPHVDVLHGVDVHTFEVIRRLTPKSLVFLISFPRYPRPHVELAGLVAKRHARIVVLTNSPLSPVVPLANLSFLIPISLSSFVDVYAAPIAFISALTAEYAERYPDEVNAALALFEEYATDIDLFAKRPKTTE